MKSIKPVITAVFFALTGAAMAQDEESHSVSVMIANEVSDQVSAVHWMGSDVSGLDIHNMQVGETQSIVDEAGRSVLITRNEEGFTINVDGNTIEMPEMPQFGHYATFVGDADMTADFDVEFVSSDFAMPVAPINEGNTVTIFSSEPLDASVQESIKAVLVSAGRDDEVKFVSHNVYTEGRAVRVIKGAIEAEE